MFRQGRLAFLRRLARPATLTPKMIATTPTTSFSQPGIRVGWVWVGVVGGEVCGLVGSCLAVKEKVPETRCPSAEVTRQETV
jgi:hypothetical protein